MTTNKSNSLPIGYVFEHYQYRIESVLGAGGFGITYKAVHEVMLNRVAIKEYFPVEWSYRDRTHVLANTQGGLPTSEAGEEACYNWGLQRFLSEAKILFDLKHPGVVRVLYFFEANGTAYIVMEYEEGRALSEILARGNTLSEAHIRRIISDILPALDAVHVRGYLHRDLKPANLYQRSDGRTILIDFGAARQALGRRSRSVTSVFSPGYSPIEQYLVDGKSYGPWTDIYAMGAVLYHCVTGGAPIEAPARVLDDPLPPASEVAAGKYSPSLLRLIDQAMTVRPEKRFQNIEQMRAALEQTQEDEAGSTVNLELPPLRPESPRSDNNLPVEPETGFWQTLLFKKGRLWIIGMMLVTALIGGTGIWLWLDRPFPVKPQIGQSGEPNPVDEIAPKAGKDYTEVLTGTRFVWVKPGCFDMGSPETDKERNANERLHRICFNGFWMARTEVTNAQYRKFMSDHDSGRFETFSLNKDDQPVVRVTWRDANMYANWLSGQTGLRFRLPTEAEWEYAARGRKTTPYDWNDKSQSCQYANIYDETAHSNRVSHWPHYPCKDDHVVGAPVAQYAANAFGLHDMLGNVMEWTCSGYDSGYQGAETRCIDLDAPLTVQRVVRGGSWNVYPGLLRFAYRFPITAQLASFDLGFRLVLEP
ncbi:MAG: hypothetical protein CSA09_02555 [Candidatus Contendobacter odensis]|uniref:Protein kinase domain-containing protein n=1 Tax=Candidatus Contendibacter odensensis TaxID=1400860 RepID=A0A2G6PGR3_9GAMM|nr:MAG: hypothetical protein CSA09_02555 [Candidatus Contendobacter odensis]